LAIQFEPLTKQHDRSKFSCGQPSLDDWFQRRAGQDDRRNVARVFVAVDPGLGIVGFYSLSSFKVDLGDLPEDIARKLPLYDGVPAALIGRLARDVRVRGQGVGELLVADAVRRLLSVSRTIAIFAIVVDAKDERPVSFYESLSFRRFPTHANRLFLLASSAGIALEQGPP
jgi:GNAT superfamily N-acetyltransferase